MPRAIWLRSVLFLETKDVSVTVKRYWPYVCRDLVYVFDGRFDYVFADFVLIDVHVVDGGLFHVFGA